MKRKNGKMKGSRSK